MLAKTTVHRGVGDRVLLGRQSRNREEQTNGSAKCGFRK